MRVTRRLLLAATAALSIVQPAWAKDTLTFAAATFSEAGRGDLLRAWVDGFNKSQDQVEITPLAIPFSAFTTTIFTQMGGGAGPDLVRFDLQDYYAAAQSKRLLPMNDIIKDADYTFTGPDSYMHIGGQRYGVPFEISNYVLIYNQALVNKPPTDFDAFVAAAKEATTEGRYGFAFRATLAERAGFWQDVCNYVYGFGGRWSDDQGNVTLNSPDVVKGIAAYKRMYDAGATPKGADASTYRRMFWEGKLAMEVDNGGIATIFAAQAPDMKLAAAPSPFPTKAQGMILAPLTINANTKAPAAAAAFMKWMLAPENQASLQTVLGASTVATTVARSPDMLARRPWLAVFDAQTPNSIPQLVRGQEVKTPEIQQVVLEQVIRVLQGGADPQRAMDDAQQTVLTRVLRR